MRHWYSIRVKHADAEGMLNRLAAIGVQPEHIMLAASGIDYVYIYYFFKYRIP